MKPSLSAIALSCGVTMMSTLGATASAEALSVAADILPAHSLTARVMEGVGEPTLLVQSSASMHGYALRPSEAAALQAADVVIWLGPEAAAWLEGPLEALAGEARTLALEDIEGVHRLMASDETTHHHHDERHDEGHAQEDQHDEDEHDDHDDHDAHAESGRLDPHLWLDPENAKVWLSAIAATLSEADPENAARYAANAKAGIAEIDALIAETEATLAPARGRNFVVFHDAYRYFEERFDFPAVASIALHDGARPSPARLSEIQEMMTAREVRCIFSEPQFDPKIARAIATEGQTIAALDPLGAAIEPGPMLYRTLIADLATALADCLR